VQEATDAEYNRPRPARNPSQPPTKQREIEEIEAEAAIIVRQRFLEADGISLEAHETFDPTRWFGAEANGRILGPVRK
jgi:hypothetical protein